MNASKLSWSLHPTHLHMDDFLQMLALRQNQVREMRLLVQKNQEIIKKGSKKKIGKKKKKKKDRGQPGSNR